MNWSVSGSPPVLSGDHQSFVFFVSPLFVLIVFVRHPSVNISYFNLLFRNQELRNTLNIFMAIHNTDIPVNQIEMTIGKLLKWSSKSNPQEL
jgi:hypothetical protein